MDYSVEFGGKSVGKVQLTRQGLYYCVSCRCNLSGQVMYRLLVSCADRQADLGILVPMEKGFGLDTRFPVSRIGDGTPAFRLTPKHDHTDHFVPIHPEEPFAYLSRLKAAFLEMQNGQPGIRIPDSPKFQK